MIAIKIILITLYFLLSTTYIYIGIGKDEKIPPNILLGILWALIAVSTILSIII